MKPPSLTGPVPRIPTRVRPWWANYATYLDLLGFLTFIAVPVLVFVSAGGDWATFRLGGPGEALRYPPALAGLIAAGAVLLAGLTSDLAARRHVVDRFARGRFPTRPRRPWLTGDDTQLGDLVGLGMLVENLVLRHGPITFADLYGKVGEVWDNPPTTSAVGRALRGTDWLAPHQAGGPYVHVTAVRLWEALGAYGRLDAEQLWQRSGAKDAGVDLRTVQEVLASAPWASHDGVGFEVTDDAIVA